MFTDDVEKPCFARTSRTLNKPSISVWEAMDVPGEALTVTSTEFSLLEDELVEPEASLSKLETTVG